jgi:hypothetical protein
MEMSEHLFIHAPLRCHAQVRRLLAQLEPSVHQVAIEARVMVVKTAAADQMLALGKGQLILDAKAADALLDKLLKPEAGAQSLGTIRLVCQNGLPVFATADHPTNYLEKIDPVADGGGFLPKLNGVHAGIQLNLCPALTTDRKAIMVNFVGDVTAPARLRQTAFPVVAAGAPSVTKGTGTIEARVTTQPEPSDGQPASSDTQPAPAGAKTEGVPRVFSGTVTGSIIASGLRAGAPGTAMLEMPDQDWVHFGSAVRIPNNGTAVFAASARTIKATAEPDTEIILFIRAKRVD